MKRLNQIIFIWGIFDFAAIAWYIGWNLYYGKFPLINDIEKIADTSASFGLPYLSIFSYIAILIYASLILSGVYLVKQNKIGAIVSYIQTPFRLLFIIPPSIVFILWPQSILSCFLAQTIKGSVEQIAEPDRENNAVLRKGKCRIKIKVADRLAQNVSAPSEAWCFL